MNRHLNLSIKGFIFLISFFIVGHTGFSQSVVVSNLVTASDHSSNSAYSTQWAVGEIFTGTFTSNGLSVSNGLNENNIVFIVMDLETKGEELQKVEAFPNPMTGVLTIASGNLPMNELKFDFADGSGKIVNVPSISIDTNSASFNTKHLASGFYLLRIKNLKTTQTAFIKLIQK